MIRGQLPVVLAVVLIASLTLVEGIYMKDRWGTVGVEATELGKRFADVPKEIGAWVGQDLPVEDIIKNTAGAVSYVSRQYVHSTTSQKVTLWLIVGHSRDIVRHTPTVCYPSSGFRQDGALLRQHFDLAGGESADFFTAKFEKEDAFSHHVERVFWAWNHPQSKQWEAPCTSSGSENARMHYGLAKALYKLYFTSSVMNDESTADDNVAAEFAELMIPMVDKALFPEESPVAAAEETEGSPG